LIRGRQKSCVKGNKSHPFSQGSEQGSNLPHSQVQRCIVHQIHSSTHFVSYKDIKPLMADLKKVYTAITEDEGLENLVQLATFFCRARYGKNLDVRTSFTKCLQFSLSPVDNR